MCGLVGAISLGSVSDDHLLHSTRRMMQALVHRGPDATGVWLIQVPRWLWGMLDLRCRIYLRRVVSL